MSEPRQLGLLLPYAPRYGADFIAAPSNEPARQWLARTADWPAGRLALWGEPGTGKTHLLHRWADAGDAALISGGELPSTLGHGRPLAIDDADQCRDERALLHVLNSAADARVPVLLAARTPPGRWPIRIPDLASRLRAVPAVEIGPPEDELLRALLARLLAERQIAVARTVQEWLLRRLPRIACAIREVVERLDAASLAAGRRVTRDLAARELSDLVGSRPPLAGR